MSMTNVGFIILHRFDFNDGKGNKIDLYWWRKVLLRPCGSLTRR